MNESKTHTDASEQCREQAETVELSRADRGAAVKAICDRATGTTTQVAAQILTGIAALDGRRLPILLWPEDVTREEKAAWHKSEAAFWDASAIRFAEFMKSADPDGDRTPDGSPSALPIAAPEPLPLTLTSCSPAHRAADIKIDRLDQSLVPGRGANDVC
ncbi:MULTISPECIES: hypothetical protein [Pseudomonas syringae group]|uniref:Uncharacterized protein n=3 Tax=Pseudomonas syringae group TaxID=136849 RepID=A0A2K4WUF4_PSESX|nr:MULTISPECIES: hypothetical protein [Pseudomonas syringae group]RMS90149.1 hypothetical protein ALP58_00811 [Pseudomonas savastanoi]MBD1108177.1 hypothetical protein [Pseudomonas amygdali pv. morsprunorum]MBI6730592.1 hypothetical protein [Pseudomonas amygdali]MBI6812868.1 hypothetical protein [Pseudomonas amygdali]MDT3225016.1 hypothetical protein [Pseudomonas amygdali pv. morsprunorum]